VVTATALRATLAAAILVSGATAAGCSSDNTDTTPATLATTTTSSATAISTTAPPTPAALPGVGDEVRDGPFAFVVSSVTGSRYAGDPDNEHLQERAQGLYLITYIRVTNISSVPQVFYATEQTLRVPGRILAVDDRAARLADSARVPINPGNSAEVKLAFDCPPDVLMRGESGYSVLTAVVIMLRGIRESAGAAVDLNAGRY